MEPNSTSQPAEPDGELDCAGGELWFAEPGMDLDAPGEPTAEAALRPFLEEWQTLCGGEIAMVGADHAALTLDGAEVVVASTAQTNPGGFAVHGSTGCDGFEPEVLPGPPSSDNPNPATAPSVT